MVNVGDRVKDKVTGFEGTVMSRTTYLFGCVRLSVQADVDAEGKMGGSEPFDEPALTVLLARPKPPQDDQPG
jgi:hypothetical protein